MSTEKKKQSKQAEAEEPYKIARSIFKAKGPETKSPSPSKQYREREREREGEREKKRERT